MKCKSILCAAVVCLNFQVAAYANPSAFPISSAANFYFADLSDQLTNYCVKHNEECGVSVIDPFGMPYLVSGSSCAMTGLIGYSADKASASGYFGQPGKVLEKYASSNGPLFRYRHMIYPFFTFDFSPGSYPIFYKNHLIGGVGVSVKDRSKSSFTADQLAKRFATEWETYISQGKKIKSVQESLKGRTTKGSVASLLAIRAGLTYCKKINLKCYISISDGAGLIKGEMRNIGAPRLANAVADARASTAAYTGIDTSHTANQYHVFVVNQGDIKGAPVLAGGKPISYKGYIIGGIGVGIPLNSVNLSKPMRTAAINKITNTVYANFLEHYYPESKRGCRVVL